MFYNKLTIVNLETNKYLLLFMALWGTRAASQASQMQRELSLIEFTNAIHDCHQRSNITADAEAHEILRRDLN